MSTSVLPVILLFSLGAPCLLCDPAVDVRVRRGQNVSLPCHINSSSVLAWYRLHAHRMTLLLSANRGNLQKAAFVIDQNEERSRFGLAADGRLEAVALLISGVTDADLGLYFCAAGLGLSNMRFGTAVRLSLAGAEQRLASDGVGFSALWICVCVCVCVTCGFCGFLSAYVLRYRKGSSCINCVKQNSNVQAAPVQYSSLRFIRRSRPAAPAPADVTYATISKHTP